MDGIAQAQFIVFQNFPAKCVYCNILGSGQEGEQGGKPQDGPDAFFGVETAKGTNGEQQADLGEIGRAHSELQSHHDLVCRLLLEKKKKRTAKKKKAKRTKAKMGTREIG